MQKLLIGKREAAEMLSVGVSTLDRLVAAGEVPSIRLGGSVKFSVEQLKQMVNERSRYGDNGSNTTSDGIIETANGKA